MAVILSADMSLHSRSQKRRRTATSVMAGGFDYIPPRDVLTSLLNGVGPNKDVEGEEEAKKAKKKKEVKKDKRRDSSAKHDSLQIPFSTDAPQVASTSSNPPPAAGPSQPKKKKSFWSAHPQRPNIQIMMNQERSLSVTPPPESFPQIPSASSTPGPSISSSTSRTSSKRPRTPEDDEEIVEVQPMSPPPKKERKKRKAHKKGWKGWIEGSPQPSEKLINLDCAPVLRERRLRSGKNFDAISVGNQTWV